MPLLHRLAVFACALVAIASMASTGRAQTSTVTPSKCDTMRQMMDPKITARMMGIPDAPTLIESARVVPATEKLPEHCDLIGHIAPDIGFQIRLPTTQWNGKLWMQGCGGFCGQLSSNQGEPALARGYAVVATDMGHTTKGWMFAYNNIQGEIDFGFRSTHVTAVAAKEIIDSYYGMAAKLSYFNGCSTGGRQAMVEAQRFPYDFNGIIGGAPPYNETGDRPLALFWAARANIGTDGKPLLDASDLPFIHGAVLQACDELDGLKDGLLQNPARCLWNPGEIQCGAKGMAVGAKCLSPEQVGAVRKIYSGAVNSKGEALYFGMPRGSEWNWTPDFVGANGKPASDLGGPYNPSTSLMNFMPFFYDGGPGYDPMTYDYDRDPQRMAMMESLHSASNPDLRKFKAAGGKFILWHGWDDNQIPAGASVDYYETATRTMGGEAATTDFMRLYMLPNTGHCAMGPGGAEIDWITALENWVEKGQAPDQLTVYHLKQPGYLPRPYHPLKAEEYDRTRAIYPYPAVAKYSGKGDANIAANWVRASK